VFVRDSAVAGEKLALAQRMERLKEWDKSADVYQEIVEKYADRVVPSTTQPAGGAAAAPGTPQRYKSVTMSVQERLGKWPEEGLAMYRARYEAQAAAMREQAGVDDAAALSRVTQLASIAIDAACTVDFLNGIDQFVRRGDAPQRARQRRSRWRNRHGTARKRAHERLIVFHENRSVLQHGSVISPLGASDELAVTDDELAGGRSLEAWRRGRYQRTIARRGDLYRHAEPAKPVDE